MRVSGEEAGRFESFPALMAGYGELPTEAREAADFDLDVERDFPGLPHDWVSFRDLSRAFSGDGLRY